MTETSQSLPIEIKHRHTDAVLYRSTKAKDLRAAVIEAVAAGAYLYGANLSGAYLYGAYLYGANLSGANLSGANLSGANLSGANLSEANLSGAYLYGAYLSGAYLYGAYLSGANLYGANLSEANLYGANLSGAYLYGAYLYGANLSGANLYGAYLSGANLYGANLYGSKLAKGSLAAFAGPVGAADRAVMAFIARADDDHKKPYLLLTCGCFTGDEKAYRAKVKERYSPKSAHYKQCMAALTMCKAISATWKIVIETPEEIAAQEAKFKADMAKIEAKAKEAKS